LIFPIISVLVGLYFITLGLWELKEGVNRKQYIKYNVYWLIFAGSFTPYDLAILK